MLINDNLSVALSLPERVGLHIGQEDIPVPRARELLGPKRLLGISVKNVEQARAARASGADYAGVGPCYGTLSKAGITDDKVIGVRGAREVVQALAPMPSVLIGGINQKTAARALFGATSAQARPRGIAVISAVVSRTDPDVAAAELAAIVTRYNQRLQGQLGCSAPLQSPVAPASASAAYVAAAASLLAQHRASASASASGPPLIQTITSHVSSTMSANIALAFSSSPIMSHEAEEAEDLSAAIGALVLNIGTIGPPSRAGMRVAGNAANRGGKPVVLDPVGCGATRFRRGVVDEILGHTQVTLIKGNAAELGAIAGSSEVQARGVDSGSGTLRDPVGLVRSLAQGERCLVLLSGKRDYLSDGARVIACDNGHPLLGSITGSGCALGVMIAAALAAACSHAPNPPIPHPRLDSFLTNSHGADLLVAALTALLAMTIASEKAAARPDVSGPGSFIPALIDEIAAVSPADLTAMAKVTLVPEPQSL